MNQNNTFIVNYWWTENYGAILTAYALQSLVENSVLLNNYDKSSIIRQEKHNSDFAKKFAKKMLNYSEIITCSSDLSRCSNNASIFITGSDQVFRAGYLSDKLYSQNFLDFVHPNVKKIAFSASFAVDKDGFLKETDSETVNKVRDSLKSFDRISVREKSGVDICKDVFGLDAKWIIDPVFIVDKINYEKLIDNATENYSGQIVSYVLDSGKQYKKAYKYLSNKYGKKVTEISNSNISPENWLKSIRDCDLFITDSFHGLCFALIFNKKFICISNKNRGFARFKSILDMLNISYQCIDSIDEIYLKDCIFNIDYDCVNKEIEKQRQIGLEFLKEALECSPGHVEEKRRVRTRYLEDGICEAEKQASLKYQIKKELWTVWLIIFHKYLPSCIKSMIRKLRRRGNG